MSRNLKCNLYVKITERNVSRRQNYVLLNFVKTFIKFNLYEHVFVLIYNFVTVQNMRQRFTRFYMGMILIALATFINFAFTEVTRSKNIARTDTSYFHLGKNKTAAKSSYLKNGFRIPFPSIKSIISPSSSKANMAKPADDHLLNSVQITPNPVVDQITLKYFVSRNSNVTIKIMDVLGNNRLTLFSQRVDPGEQKFTYNLNKQLSSGFYFVRVVVGTESVIKRISIL